MSATERVPGAEAVGAKAVTKTSALPTRRLSLFDDPRWTSGPIFERYLEDEPRAPNAAALRTFIDRTATRGRSDHALYDAARLIEQLEVGATS